MTMRRLHLDFLRERPPLPAASLVVLVLGGIAMLAALADLMALNREVDAASAALAGASVRAQADVPRGPVDGEALARDAAEAAQIAAALNLAWPVLFRQLERIRVNGVTLIAIQPETSSAARRFRIGGEARQLDSALAYVAQLAETRGFANVHLASHEVLADRGGSALQFVAIVDWMPPP